MLFTGLNTLYIQSLIGSRLSRRNLSNLLLQQTVKTRNRLAIKGLTSGLFLLLAKSTCDLLQMKLLLKRLNFLVEYPLYILRSSHSHLDTSCRSNRGFLFLHVPTLFPLPLRPGKWRQRRAQLSRVEKLTSFQFIFLLDVCSWIDKNYDACFSCVSIGSRVRCRLARTIVQ